MHISFQMTPKAPYHFEQMTNRIAFVDPDLYRDWQGGLLRTVRIGRTVCLVGVRSLGTVEEPVLQVEAWSSGHDVPQAAMARQVERMYSTSIDMEPFYQHIASDPVLASLAQRLRGLRIMQTADLFESLVKTIIGQQMNLSFASTLTKRLIERASAPFLWEGQKYPVFPSPEDIAVLTYEDLTALQFSRRKAEYVIDLARTIAGGQLALHELYDLTDQEVMERLITLRGIGRWTVECFLLFGMGRPDLLPAADIGLRNGLKNLYGFTENPGEQEIRELGAWWSPWSSYVTYYVWESLKLPEASRSSKNRRRSLE